MAKSVDDFKTKHDPLTIIRRLETELRTANEQIGIEEAIKGLLGTASQRLDALNPPAWIFDAPTELDAPGVPMLFLSDLHWGEVVDPAQINGVNKFNVSIAQERLQRTIKTTMRLLHLLDHQKRYPGIVVALGGDMISGNIHDELMATNEINTMPTVLDLYEHLVSAFKTLADEYGKVFVPCVSGNHGRDTKKTWSKDRNATSFDWLLYQFLARHFAGDDRFSFYIPAGSDALFRIHNTRFLLTHGDQFKAGDSIIGPLGPLCVTPETPVLMADLTYRRAGDLKAGDKLVGFDEHSEGARRKFREAEVTETAIRHLECVEIATSDGTMVRASLDHPWLVQSGGAHVWRKTEDLKLGDQILSLGAPPQRLDSWEAGYLAGVLDGEGSVERKGRLKFSQQRNACLETATAILDGFGIPYNLHENGAATRGFEPCFSIALNPGRETAGVEHLRLLWSVMPPRILAEHGRRLWEGRSVQIAGRATVTGLRNIGLRETAAFTTSTATFVANGLLTHNTRGAQKKQARNQAVDQEFDVMMCGHWHQLIFLSYLLVNGSLKGYDEYAAQGNFRFEPPQQALITVHPDYGINWRMPVLCEKPVKRKKAPWVSAFGG